ncbi:MAG: hypothetical protein P8Z30_12230, partial [Acidobacteriota bacterium]
ALWVWARLVSPESSGSTFLLGQAVNLLWIGVRLWLRASETRWYRIVAPAVAPPVPPPSTPV